jgi:hypothetical protein
MFYGMIVNVRLGLGSEIYYMIHVKFINYKKLLLIYTILRHMI